MPSLRFPRRSPSTGSSAGFARPKFERTGDHLPKKVPAEDLRELATSCDWVCLFLLAPLVMAMLFVELDVSSTAGLAGSPQFSTSDVAVGQTNLEDVMRARFA